MSSHAARRLGSDGDDALSQVTRGSMLNLGGAVVAMVGGLAVVIIVGQAHGAAGAGVFFTATAMFTLAANGAKLGAESGLTYLVSRCRATGRQASIPRLVWSVLAMVGALTSVVAIAGVVLAPLLAPLLTDDPALEADLTRMLVILSIAVPTWTVSQAAFGATRGFATMRPSVLAGQIVRPGTQIAGVAAVVLFTDELWPLAAAWAVASGFTLVPVLVWLARRLATIDGDGPDVRAEFWSYARPRAGADLLHSALERLDVVLTGAIVGSAAAGVYGAANRLVVAGQLIMQASGQAMAPHLGAKFAVDDREAIRDLLVITTTLLVLVLWPIFLLLAFGAPAVLGLFGSGFDTTSVVVVLAVGVVVVSGLGPGDLVLLMAGGARASLVNHVMALATMVTVALTLLPSVGVVGAAWAWVASRVVLRVLSVWHVWRLARVHPFGLVTLRVMALTVAVYVPVGLAGRLALGDGLLALVTYGLVAVVLHAAVLWWRRSALGLEPLVQLVTRR